MSLCETSPEGLGFIGSVLRWGDCQAETFSLGSWQALSAPGSTLSLVLSGTLTLFIALIGYNLLLGRGPTVRSGTVAMIKIGAVLALATSWPAYKTLVYDVVVDAPAQLFAELSAPTLAGVDDTSLSKRLDAVDAGLAQLAILGSGTPTNSAGQPVTQQVPPPFIGFNTFALGGARITFLCTALASLLPIRFVAALVLAIGPLLIAFFFFDGTRSIFEGWVRVTFGAALAGLGARFAIAVQLSMLEPWLVDVLARRQADQALPAMPTELLVLITLFSLLALAIVWGSTRVARGFRLAPVQQWLSETWIQRQQLDDRRSPHVDVASAVPATTVSTSQRSQAIARSVADRERVWSVGPGAGVGANRRETVGRSESSVMFVQGSSTRLGQTARRTNRSRVAASAKRRDARS